MSNYSLLITPTYTPRSFQEMIAPYQMYGQYYDTLETALSTLENGLADMEKIQNVEGSEELYNRYKNFESQLRGYSDRLSTGDLKGLRSLIKDASKEYVKQIKPIEDAYNRMTAVNKAYQEALAKDPTLLSRPDNRLQTYYDDPNYVFKPISGNAITAAVGALAQAYQNEYSHSTNTGNFTVHHYGLNSSDLPAIAAGQSKKYQRLYEDMKGALAGFGFDDMDSTTQALAMQYATRGLSYGLGKDDIDRNPVASGSNGRGSKKTDNIYGKPIIGAQVKDNSGQRKAIDEWRDAKDKAEQTNLQYKIYQLIRPSNVDKKEQDRRIKTIGGMVSKWSWEDMHYIVNNFNVIKDGEGSLKLPSGLTAWGDTFKKNGISKELLETLLVSEGQEREVAVPRQAKWYENEFRTQFDTEVKAVTPFMAFNDVASMDRDDIHVVNNNKKYEKMTKEVLGGYDVDSYNSPDVIINANERRASVNNYTINMPVLDQDTKQTLSTVMQIAAEGSNNNTNKKITSPAGAGLYIKNGDKWKTVSLQDMPKANPKTISYTSEGISMLVEDDEGKMQRYMAITPGMVDANRATQEIHKAINSRVLEKANTIKTVQLPTGGEFRYWDDANGERWFEGVEYDENQGGWVHKALPANDQNIGTYCTVLFNQQLNQLNL